MRARRRRLARLRRTHTPDHRRVQAERDRDAWRREERWHNVAVAGIWSFFTAARIASVLYGTKAIFDRVAP